MRIELYPTTISPQKEFLRSNRIESKGKRAVPLTHPFIHLYPFIYFLCFFRGIPGWFKMEMEMEMG